MTGCGVILFRDDGEELGGMGAGIGLLELEFPFSSVDKTLDLAGDLEKIVLPCSRCCL